MKINEVIVEKGKDLCESKWCLRPVLRYIEIVDNNFYKHADCEFVFIPVIIGTVD